MSASLRAHPVRRAPGPSVAEPLVLGAAASLVAIVVIVPLVAVASRVDAGSLSVLKSARVWLLLARSVLLATTVTLGTLIFGVPLGAVFARARLPMRRTLLALHLLPIFLPPFFAALGWFHIFGAHGLAGNAGTASVLFGPIGAWAVLVAAFAPIVTALTALGVRALDPSVEEAARLVASPRRVATRILVPAAGPQIVLAALVVFALALGELGVPMFLRVDAYPSAVFARLGGVDFAPGDAATLSLPILGIAALLLLLEHRLLGGLGAASLSLRAATREPLPLGRLATVLAVAASLVSVTPLVALAAHAAPAVARLHEWVASSVQNGLVASFATATVATGVGFFVGHAFAKGSRIARGVDLALVFAFFVPSAVLGVGLATAWNHPRTEVVYGSSAIVVLALVARYGVLAERVVAAFVAQRSPAYEEAAAVAGAGYLVRLLRIVAPMELAGLIAAFGLTLVFCLRDLETVVLLYPPGAEPLTVRIFTLEANGPSRVVAGLATLHVAITATVLLLVAWIYARRRR